MHLLLQLIIIRRKSKSLCYNKRQEKDLFWTDGKGKAILNLNYQKDKQNPKINKQKSQINK